VEYKLIGSAHEKIRGRLSEILASSDMIRLVALITRDGFTIALRSNGVNVDPKWLGALVSFSLKHLEKSIGRLMGNKSVSDVVIVMGDDQLVIRSIEKLLMVIIADKNLDINFLLYETAVSLQEIREELGL